MYLLCTDFSSMAVCTEEDSYNTIQTLELVPESEIYSETREKKMQKPVFVTKLSPAIVTVGNTAKFTVVLAGFPKPVVQWYHSGQVITSSSIYTFVQENEEYTLVISNVKKELEGQYTCTASNRFGKSTCASYLHVKLKDAKKVEQAIGQPPYFTKEIESVQCRVGGQAVFEYRVTGSPFPEIQWFRGSHRLHPSKYCIIVSNVDGSGCIKIMELQQSDGGLYSCRASNPLGETFCNAELIVFLDTASASQHQKQVASTKQKTYKISTSEHATESRLYSVSLSGHARASLQEGDQMIYTIGTEERQVVSSEQAETLHEIDVSSATVHREQVTHQAAVLQSHEMQERVAVVLTEPQQAMAAAQKQLRMATMTSAVQESQGFTEQHSDRIKSPEVIELDLTEEQPSRVTAAISQSVTPLTIVKADLLAFSEGESICVVPEPKQTVNSPQVETKLAILNEEYKNLPYPEEEKTFRVAEGVKLLYSAVSSENLQVTEAHSSLLSSLEFSESLPGEEKPKPILTSVSEVKHTLSKESRLEMDKPVEEVALLSKEQMLKSASIAEEKHMLNAEKSAAISGLDSAVSGHSQKEEEQMLHIQVVRDQDTLPSQGRFTSGKPRTERADTMKSSTLLQTMSVDDQTAVHCEHLSELSFKKITECLKPQKEAPTKIYLQAMQTETTLYKEGLLSVEEPDQQKALLRQEKTRKYATTTEEKLNLTADSSKDLDVSVKGVKPEHNKEPKCLNILHVVSEPMLLPKESPLVSCDKEHHALLEKEDHWNVVHAMSVLDNYALEEGHTDSVQAMDKFTCKVDLEPNLDIQSAHIEEKAISTESCATLEAAEQDYAVHIQEGQSVKQSILIEEKQTLTGEISKEITKSETATINILTEPSEPLLVTESRECKTLPKELTFVISAPNPHSLDIRPQLKNALQCAVACDQPLILADVLGSLRVLDVKEVKVHKEPRYAMFSYLITTPSAPVEITIAFEGEYSQIANLRSELQSALNSMIYQEHQVFTSEQPETLSVLRPHRVQLRTATSQEMLLSVVESVQLTENVEVFVPSKGQSAALKTEAKESFKCITDQEQPIVQESKHQAIQMAPEAKSDFLESGQSSTQEIKSASVQEERAVIFEGLTTNIPVAPCPVERSTDVLIEKEKSVEFIKEDIILKRTPEHGLAQGIAFELPLEDIAVAENSVVTFTVGIRNVNQVNWFFNDKSIKSGNEFKCSKHHDTYNLVINKVTKGKHEGEYTCEAVSEGGKASTSARLTILSRGLIMALSLSQ